MPDGTLSRPMLRGSDCDDAPGLMPPAMARRRLLAGAAPVDGSEILAPAVALGRVLATAPRAARDLPPFDQSAMDGYGLGAEALSGAAAPRLVRTNAPGDPAGPALGFGEAVRVLTGAALPFGVAGVVMQEHAEPAGGRLHLHRRPASGENIRRRGEDVARGSALAPPGTRLDARHAALLAAAGVATVAVRRPVRVALLSNGNELGTSIHDSNRPMLAALLARPELACTDLGIVADDRARLASALAGAATTHDLILTTGGISGSEADQLPHAIAAAGGTVERLRLALKPGKPLAFGRIGDAIVLCLPGNPLAALVGMLLFGRPLLARLAGDTTAATPLVAIAGEDIAHRPGQEEYLPARITGHDAHGRPVLVREGRSGSARLAPLARADGLMCLDAEAATVAPGDAVRFHPFTTCFGL
jgi:molybdopterin molybdotransferase